MSPNVRAPRKYRATFGFAGLNVGVAASSRADLDWLAEFIRPQFAVRATRRVDCTVSFEQDASRFGRLLRRGPHPSGGRVLCFALDTKLETHPLWDAPRRERWVFDRNFQVFYQVQHDGSSVNILHEGRRSSRLSLMRVVREFAMAHVRDRGELLVHGAAFHVDGRGAIIAGEKRAGKTSLLIHALEGDGVRYISNDRVAVGSPGRRPRMRGMPTIASVRCPTLDHFEDLGERIRESSYFPHLTLREARRPGQAPARPWKRRQYNFSPAQLCRLMGAGNRSGGSLDAVLFPSITRSRGRIRLRRMPRREALEQLVAARFRAGARRVLSGLFCPPLPAKPADDDAATEALEWLAQRVPCFDCQIGQQAYGGSDWARRFVQRLDR